MNGALACALIVPFVASIACFGIHVGFQIFLWTASLGALSNCAIAATGAVQLYRALGCSASNFAYSSTVYGAVATAVGALQLLLCAGSMVVFSAQLRDAIQDLLSARNVD